MDLILSWVTSSLGTTYTFLKDHYEAIIAICALGFTAFEVHMTRKHNRLSVRPNLSIKLTIDKASNDSLHVFEYRLKNSGIGPGEIKKVEFFFKGKNIAHDFESMAHFLTHQLDEIQDQYEAPLGGAIFNHFLGPGVIVEPQREETAFAFKCNECTPQTLEAIEEVFKDLSIKMDYASLYGEMFSFSRNEKAIAPHKRS